MKRRLPLLLVIVFQLVIGSFVFAQGTVTGSVVEQDGTTPVLNASVTFSGIDFQGDTVSCSFLSDSLGCYFAEMNTGVYQAVASASGYADCVLADSIVVADSLLIEHVDFILNELYVPVQYVMARYFDNSMAKVTWAKSSSDLVEDFETGDFSKLDWNNGISECPWRITEVNPYQGSYCMKSSCEGLGSGVSEIEVVVNLLVDSRISFYERVSSESPWDCGSFYIDDVKMGEYSGESDWQEVSFDVAEGPHVFRWGYMKDASIDVGEDCFCVDNIRFFNALTKTETESRSFQYYQLYRRRFSETPMLLASHLTDSSFVDVGWNNLPWGQYYYGVSCIYEGNRGESEIVWSNGLDKDLTTEFELFATTNSGVIPAGAAVSLLSSDTLGTDYFATLDEMGHCLISEVVRGDYWVTVGLAGYEEFVSDSLVNISEHIDYHVELVEKKYDIDSLYVSSTGWAMWSMPDSLLTSVQHFEIILDTMPVCSIYALHCQLDVDDFVSGETYLLKVRPVYLSGAGDWAEAFFTYRSCSDFLPTLDGLFVERIPEGTRIYWNNPLSDSLIGAVFYRNEQYLGFATEDSFLDEEPLPYGVTWWQVRLVYDGQLPDAYYSMSCLESVSVYNPLLCNPPQNLEGGNYFNDENDFGALLSWGIRPEPIAEWLHYDNGLYDMALGADGMIYWGIKFDAEDLASYRGSALTKISIFDIAAGTYQIWIYFGEEITSHTLVHYQNMSLDGCNDWHTETLSTNLNLPENESVWIVIGQHGITYPAAACAATGNPNGSWVSMDGVTWNELSYYNLDYTWMLRAFVTNQFSKAENDNLLKYNVYRSYDNQNYSLIASVSYDENVGFYQYKDVLVGDVHSVFYYQVRAEYESGCESEPALSLFNPTQNFVVVDDAWDLNEYSLSQNVYPNPTDGKIMISGRNIDQVAVFDAFGRNVFVSDCTANEIQIDLSHCADGLYLLRVVSQNGAETHRVMLAH